MIYFLIIAIGMAVYLVANTYYVQVNRTEIRAGIQSKFKFVHISDIHGTTRFLNGKLSKLINDISPDFVVVTGDLSNNRKQLPKVLLELEGIHALRGIYVVLGNYEGQELKWFRKIDRGIGETVKQIACIPNITLLKNDLQVLNINNNNILIYGFDNSTYGNESYSYDIEQLKHDYKIILAHSPSIIRIIRDTGISCNQILVGHTHGGQINVGKNLQLGEYKDYHVGAKWVDDKLFCINKGLGTVKIPFRLNCFPEISVYDVVPG